MKITDLDKKIFMPVIYLIVASILLFISIKTALNSHYDYKIEGCLDYLKTERIEKNKNASYTDLGGCIKIINGSL